MSEPPAGLAAAAALAVGAAALLQRVPDDAPRPPTGYPPGRHLVEGIRLLAREERAALVVGVTMAKHVVMGAIRSFLVIAPLGLLGMGDGGAGLLSVALGAGGLLGGAAAVLLVGRRRLTPAFTAGAIALGLPLIAIGLRPGVGVAIVALAVAGSGRTISTSPVATLIGRVSPEEALARFLGILESSSYVGLALGSIAAALLVEAVDIRTALLVAGGFLPVLAIVLIRPLAAIDQGPVVSRDRLHLILGVPMFAALPPEGVERLASHLVPTALGSGVVVVEQGELGDRYDLVEDGAVEAVIDGEVVSSSGPGTGFGEIALLRDVPRTATVRTTAPSRLLTVDRSHFVSVVTGEPASRLEAEQLVSHRLLRDSGRLGGRTPAGHADSRSATDLVLEVCPMSDAPPPDDPTT